MSSLQADSMIEYLRENVDSTSIDTILHKAKLNEITASATLLSMVIKRTIISLDTGLQKTSVMCALGKISRIVSGFNKIPLLVIPKEASHNIPKIKEWLTGLHVSVLDSEFGVEGRIPTYNELISDKTDILIISPRLLFSRDFVNMYILGANKLIDTIIIDEAHILSNPETQYGHMLRLLSERVERLYLLTATPGRNPEEFEFLSSLVNPNYGYISVTRKDLDIEGDFHIIMKKMSTNDIPKDDVRLEEPNKLYRYRKSVSKNSKLVKEMMIFLKNNHHTGILVYTRFLEAQRVLYDLLRKEGIRVEMVNSNTSANERLQVGERVKNDEVDIVITTITTSLDIPFKCVACWGWCSDIVQLIGRLNRSYDKKDIVIYLQLLEFEIELLEKHIDALTELAFLTDKSTSLFNSIYKKLREW